MTDLVCPCGAQQRDHRGKKRPVSYDSCCGRYHQFTQGQYRKAPTCEALMRSRYCAFARADERYLLATWHPRTRPAAIDFDSNQHWLGLRVLDIQRGLPDDDEGYVTFVARYKISGKGYRLKEKSRFVRQRGAWVYLDGEPDPL